jgi:hypothetical protein
MRTNLPILILLSPAPARGRVSRTVEYDYRYISENARMQGTDISSYSVIWLDLFGTFYANAAQSLSILSFRVWRISYRTFFEKYNSLARLTILLARYLPYAIYMILLIAFKQL